MLRSRIFTRAMSSTGKPVLKNPKLLRDKSYVDGQWISASSGKTFKVFDPATCQEIGSVPEHTAADYAKAIEHAKKAFASFSKTSNRERSNLLRKWASLLTENSEDLAKILTWENGKPLPEAKGEIASCVANFEWFSEEAPRIYGDTIPSQNPNTRIHTIKQPVGVCGIITPWNFPASMISRKVGAAVATGCTTVIKPAAETPYSALALAYLAEEAGIPKGVVNVLTTNEHVQDVGREICENPLVSKVTFTGSTNVGRILMKQAASTLKKVSFELGGNAPFIVFEDADIDAAVDGAIASKFRGSGQTCICANRFYVHEKIYDEFAKKLAAKVSGFKVGNGLEEGTTQGPLINEKAVQKVDRHVQDALGKHAHALVGGKPATELGENFYSPTVLVDVDASMAVTQEETFGPLAALSKFSTDEEVIKLANNVEVGLAAYIYTNNNSRVHRVSEGLQVGMVGVNTGLITESALPFGGVKESGFGREGSKYGLDDYLVIKSVVNAI
ncbi:succinate-semialdehyde dehydrogenase (NAD(P)(+)) [Sugiyamaella lignohabitans]|uniref:Succinate-semialdehyde dehydrogenase n=1 Tax=Sugiyamaella lignohabitans TaxID=796027 RepID=A0A167ESY4_9ASCO|nr:succinate-semialdehyde dehydrogenase (NAD(P)(+)) [Sugiyamaella lignohabitans]ANB14416.1 succinate-semialdehyde dehydrogenase (NAD(P)(+)) [Sugiyamaella lignohabitans]